MTQMSYKKWRELIEARVHVPRGCPWASEDSHREGLAWQDAVRAIIHEE
jgi:hypothetical protein